MSARAAASLSYPLPIVAEPRSGEATGAVIFLHGLGDTGAGWADIAPQFQSRLPNVRFIFPSAPLRPITINGGMQMPGWYDITSLDGINRQEDEEGLLQSKGYLEDLIRQQEAAGVPSSRVVVGGFSQGGAVALLMLRSKLKLAAVVGLSTYLPLSNAPEVLSPENKDTPVLMCHGDADAVVAYQYGRSSHAKLAALGVAADFATYRGMAHTACPSELQDIADFLVQQLGS